MGVPKGFIIIIGGSRCGTTSLFHYLSNHHQILPSFNKETRFFLEDTYNIDRPSRLPFDGNLETYLKFFPSLSEDHDFWLLEGSPDYLYSHVTPFRIESVLKNYPIHLIVIARDPVERFLSWYKYDKQLGNISHKTTLAQYFELNLEGSEMRAAKRLVTGRYSRYLSNYTQQSAYHIHLYRFESMTDDPAGFVDQVIADIGLDKFFGNQSFEVHNPSHEVKNRFLNGIYSKAKRGIVNKVQPGIFYNTARVISKMYQRFNYRPAKEVRKDKFPEGRIREYYEDEYKFINSIKN